MDARSDVLVGVRGGGVGWGGGPEGWGGPGLDQCTMYIQAAPCAGGDIFYGA